MDRAATHKKTYDRLASEYEARADIRVGVTRDALDFFSPYIVPNGTVLDVGCGVGTTVNLLTKMGFLAIGIDISPKMAAYARIRNPEARIIIADFLKANFDRKFNAVVAFAFIHLFPETEVFDVFTTIRSNLDSQGVALISSTESPASAECWASKSDYTGKGQRFRKFWTKDELANALEKYHFKILAVRNFSDPFDKVWMDFIVQPRR